LEQLLAIATNFTVNNHLGGQIGPQKLPKIILDVDNGRAKNQEREGGIFWRRQSRKYGSQPETQEADSVNAGLFFEKLDAAQYIGDSGRDGGLSEFAAAVATSHVIKAQNVIAASSQLTRKIDHEAVGDVLLFGKCLTKDKTRSVAILLWMVQDAKQGMVFTMEKKRRLNSSTGDFYQGSSVLQFFNQHQPAHDFHFSITRRKN
jgi:hypothetical protein